MSQVIKTPVYSTSNFVTGNQNTYPQMVVAGNKTPTRSTIIAITGLTIISITIESLLLLLFLVPELGGG